MWWSSSCKGSSLPRIGSWTAGKVSSPHGRMDWRILSAPLERCMWNVTSVMSKPMLFSSLPSCTPLVSGPNCSSTSTYHWRNIRSSFACRRQTWRCKRWYWQRSMRAASISPMGRTYQQNWKRPTCAWMGSTVSTPPRLSDYCS
jgi:hypothetical protein